MAKNANVDYLPELTFEPGTRISFKELAVNQGSERAVFMHFLAGNITIDLEAQDLEASLVELKVSHPHA